ncbi:MAG TPA: Ig-like domain-containing protein, partial [Candidatus Binatia bacterium]
TAGPSTGGAPSVSITSPVAGSNVKGKVKISANASDSDGIAGVQFLLDGQILGAEDTVAPFVVTWNASNTTNGVHTLTAVARDALGNRTTSAPVTVTVAGSRQRISATFSPQNVIWTDSVNVQVSGNSLQENCGGCSNSGAHSAQLLSSGNGYVEFTASETTTQRSIGLSRGNSNNSRADIDFAISLWSAAATGTPYVEVYENDTYRWGSVSYAPGDVFRIAVTSGAVKYSKNGVVFYTSTTRPRYPLSVDTSLWSPGATVANVVISRTS